MIINNFKKGKEEKTTEITPMEEMTEEQERQTIISLYYTNIETNTLMPEAKGIDAKDLLEKPYETLINYLLESPKNEKLKSSIPAGTKVNKIQKQGNTLVLDLSKEFIENQNQESMNLAIYSIVNTLTELNEVEYVKILIDSEENVKVEGTDIVLNKNFTRESISV